MVLKSKNRARQKKPRDKKSGLKPELIRRMALLFGCLLGFGFIVLGFTLYVDAYSDKILPNVRLGGVSLGGKTVTSARNEIYNLTQKITGSEIVLKIEGVEYKESLSVLGLQYNADASVQSAYSFGHSGKWTSDARAALQALVSVQRFYPVINDGTEQIERWVLTVADKVDEPVRQANIEVKNGQAEVIAPAPGNQINKKILLTRINNELLRLRNPVLEAKREVVKPEILADDAEKLKGRAVELTNETLVLKSAGNYYRVKPAIQGKWIELKKAEGRIYVSFSNDKVKEYLDSISANVNRPPVDAKFTFTTGGLKIIRNSVSGKSLNIALAADRIVSLLEQEEPRELELPLDEQKARINEELVWNVAKYGIKEKISSATTSFAKSPQNRIHNIKTGVQFLNGIVLEPGQEFSTVKFLGKIDGSSGYLPELVIKEDRTVPEFGGGLCQVSTTLFRAALHAGLKITERANHAYRVSYYEPPVGMDATIYSPRPDLRFINNTPAYILIQGSVSGSSVTFDFYGTNDGRRVVISEPEIYNITPPGESIYINDPSLEPGTVKQIERAHEGAKTKFYYKVFNKDGSVKLSQIFVSSYVPWPAKFLKGPDKPPEDKPPQ